MYNPFWSTSSLKVVYNRNTKMFTCISSYWCKGESDEIVFETDTDCDGVSKAIMNDTEAYCFNELIGRIKHELNEDRIHHLMCGHHLYEGNYISADYDCGVNRRSGIKIHEFDTYRKGHYVRCTFENRWGRWDY